MQIFLQPPNPQALSFEVDFQIQKAIVALRRSSITIRGAGRFGDGLSAIVIQRDLDVSNAMAALELAGIRISHFVTLSWTSDQQAVEKRVSTACALTLISPGPHPAQ
jgi:hypothetical protein